VVRRLVVANIIEEGRWGGPQKRITEVATELLNYDVETVVVLPHSNSGRFQRELRQRSVQFELTDLTTLHGGFFPGLRYLGLLVPDLVRLVRFLRQRPFDLIHVSGGAWQIKGAIAGKIVGVPVVWHLNDSLMPAIVVRLFRMIAGKLATAFIVSAERSRTYYLSTPTLRRFPTFCLPAPVDTKKFDPANSFVETLSSTYHGIRVLLVANINAIKGIDRLIDAAKLLLEAGGHYSFIVAGPVFQTQKRYFQSLLDRIEKYEIGSSFHFIGEVDDVASILMGADIYVCSSRAESSPMSVWEAMAMERAIVSTDVGDVSLYVRGGESGCLVPIGDVHALAAAIADLAKDGDRRLRYGRRAREVVVQQLDVRVIASRTAKCYREILDVRNAKTSR